MRAHHDEVLAHQAEVQAHLTRPPQTGMFRQMVRAPLMLGAGAPMCYVLCL